MRQKAMLKHLRCGKFLSSRPHRAPAELAVDRTGAEADESYKVGNQASLLPAKVGWKCHSFTQCVSSRARLAPVSRFHDFSDRRRLFGAAVVRARAQ